MSDASPARRIRPCGDRALLVELPDTEAVLGLADALETARASDPPRPGTAPSEVAPPGIVDVVPAARTLLVTVADAAHLDPLRRTLERLRPESGAALTAPERIDTVIEVRYDGADLAEVADAVGMDTAAVIDAHTATPWRVGFGGFAPGFAYLVGGDPRLSVPRRAEPRTRVPAGSVALAGGMSGIYPRTSPGGWNLLGHTDAPLWRTDRDPPALLRPGDWVRFRAVT